MKAKFIASCFIVSSAFFFFNCTTSPGNAAAGSDSTASTKYGSYASQADWGKHLVITSGCGDCHTPKTMTAKGPAPDEARAMSGSPLPALLPDIMPEQVAKGTAATVDQTAWIGPWGKSYAANITSDFTGIGNWTEEQFIYCLRNGVTKGLAKSRPLMPPMPWQNYAQMTDGEIKAIFAYLKTIKPVHNIVPQYEPPMAMK